MEYCKDSLDVVFQDAVVVKLLESRIHISRVIDKDATGCFPVRLEAMSIINQDCPRTTLVVLIQGPAGNHVAGSFTATNTVDTGMVVPVSRHVHV
jgi:hypothetical protein